MSSKRNLGPVAVSDVFDALSETRRRTVIQTLRRRSTPLDLDLLAESVADRVTDEPTEEVRATLHHVHLPKLDRLGLLDYDSVDRTVECDWDEHGVEESLERAKQVLDGLQRDT